MEDYNCHSNIRLTSSQENVTNTIITLLPYFKLLIIKGMPCCGKYTVTCEIFKRINASVVLFDLCKLALKISTELSNQCIVYYLNYLLKKLHNKIIISKYKDSYSQKVPKISNDNINTFHKNTNTSIKGKYGIIYIRNFNMVNNVLGDCYSKLRLFFPLIIKTFLEKLPDNIRIIITTTEYECSIPTELHWCVDLDTTREDMEYILKQFLERGDISKTDYQDILKISKIIPIGKMIYSMKYAIAMTKKEINETNTNNFNNSNNPNNNNHNNNNFIYFYKKALERFSGSIIDVEKDVSNPSEYDLIGVEDIIDELTTSIINPMKLDIPEVSIKKGLVICGPPGTGKTSIGRWLAHQIRGKFYLVGSGSNVNESIIINLFQEAVKKAKENAPAVVFVDDGDILFENNNVYRTFLTVLDGIENKKRNDICIILTCMNLRNIPSSLIRGGRLEMVLITKLPSKENISKILNKLLNDLLLILNNHCPTLSKIISEQITKEFILEISSKMVGWNYADIRRCIDDVTRLLISNKGDNILSLINKCIKQINDQYKLCAKNESTNLSHIPYDIYIS